MQSSRIEKLSAFSPTSILAHAGDPSVFLRQIAAGHSREVIATVRCRAFALGTEFSDAHRAPLQLRLSRVVFQVRLGLVLLEPVSHKRDVLNIEEGDVNNDPDDHNGTNTLYNLQDSGVERFAAD